MNLKKLSIQNDRALVAKGGLYEFVKLAWEHVNPGIAFQDNWHVEEVCKVLEDVFYLRRRRVVINIPPGCMKSLLVCVFFPVWAWIEDPSLAFMYSSFDAALTARDAAKSKELLESEWFKERWGNVLKTTGVARTAVTDYETSSGGWRFSTSVGGKATGRHPDIRVLDDPIKPKDVTPKSLETVSQYRKGTWASRQRDPATVRDIIIMQRLHEADSAGEAIEEGYDKVIFPMRYDPELHTPGDPRKTEGELLWPVRFPEEEVAVLERNMGPQVAASQLGQRPTPAGGSTFELDWFRHWTPESLPTRWDELIQSWDMTFKATTDSDLVCGGVWGRSGVNFYLLDLVCERMNFPTTLTAFLGMTTRWPLTTAKLIEDKANGPAIIDVVKKKVPGVISVTPDGGKEARASAVAPFFQAGNVFIPPKHYEWVPKYLLQMTRFPRARNDDMVDMTSQALIYFIRKGGGWLQALQKMLSERSAAG